MHSPGFQLVSATQRTDLEALPASDKAPGSSIVASSLKAFSWNCLLIPLNLFLLKLESINENPQDFIIWPSLLSVALGEQGQVMRG